MAYKKKPTLKKTWSKTNSKGKFLASGCCDITDNTRPFTKKRTNSYVKHNDLFLEPTQYSLDLSTEKYVPFLDLSNNLLDEITSIYNTSPTTHAIIDQKTTMTVGDGFTALEGKNNNLLSSMRKMRKPASLTDEQLETLNTYIHKVNPEGETLQDILIKVAADYWTYGNCFVELIKSQIDTGDKWLIVRHIPLSMCRPVKVKEGQRAVEFIAVSNRFIEEENDPKEVKLLPTYPNFETIEGLEGERSIIHLKSYSPGFSYWGLPDWIAAFLWGELEYRIPKYNQSKFVNGFTPSALVTLIANMTTEEAQSFVDAFTDKFTNTGNNSKMFINVLRDETAKADVQILEDRNEGNFMELSQLARENIITAHRWTPALTGKSVAGQLGSNQQIRAELEIIQNTVIKPAQNLIITKIINPIICEAAEWMGESWNNVSLEISTTMPISFLGDLDPAEVMTPNEQRETLGLEPLDNQFDNEITEQNERSTDINLSE
jgi:capsid portal protein